MSPLDIGYKTITYEDVVARELERAEALHNAGAETAAQDITLSIDGGRCHRCGEEWEAVPVDVTAGGRETGKPEKYFAKYIYYRPACHCYPKCKKVVRLKNDEGIYGTVDLGCGRKLYEEYDGGIRQDEDGLSFVICRGCGQRIHIDWFIKRMKEMSE